MKMKIDDIDVLIIPCCEESEKAMGKPFILYHTPNASDKDHCVEWFKDRFPSATFSGSTIIFDSQDDMIHLRLLLA